MLFNITNRPFMPNIKLWKTKIKNVHRPLFLFVLVFVFFLLISFSNIPSYFHLLPKIQFAEAAISLKTAGVWAEYVADGTVAIPGSPAAGDRMFLFATWKTYTITVAQPNGWTLIGTEFADGTTGTGNGLGSMKVMAWYRDWQSGDSAPNLDFSTATSLLGGAVIQLWQKGVGDIWDTPLTVTGGMTNWTTTSQTFSASSTVAVPNGGVVMGLVGIRDDTATMTRPAAGIDDSAAAITWNGNYVESPATHRTSGTGNDGAADLGHRFVTTGATATLRMTGTLSASETGAGKWVVQGLASTIAGTAIAGVTAPVTGATPVTTVTETAEYTGTVAWSGSPSTFASATAYTATITLTAKAGYTLTGVTANQFTIAESTGATNPANSGVITAVFPATAITYTVTFDKNTGDTDADPISISNIAYNDTVVTLPTPPTKALNTFNSWNTLANGTGTTFLASTPVTANITVYAKWTVDTTITGTAVAGVTAPVTGATPVTAVTETAEYTGTVAWSGSPSTFASNTAYTATITLTAKSGYTLTGVTADQFTIAGSTSDTNPANSGVITAVFPETAAGDTTISATAIAGVTAPVTDATPVTTVTQTVEYTGTIAWSGKPSTFASNTIYIATITLTPKSGYTLTGVTEDQFTVSGAISVTNSANSGVTTAVFPATAGITPSGGGGGGGGVTYVAPITGITFSGRAYPLSNVSILKDAQLVMTTIAGPDSNFTVSLTGLSSGNYSFSVFSEDNNGRRSTLFTFPTFITSGTTTKIGGIFIAPTISVDKSEVKKGDNIAIFGQSTSNSDITITVNSDREILGKTKSDKNGVYLYNFDTSPLEMGQHFTKSKSALSGEISSFSTVVAFTVGAKSVFVKSPIKAVRGDLNGDSRVNLVDFSIAAYWYKRPSPLPPTLIDLNGDGKVDLVDFSIMAYYWTG